jgi:hypothetical protein
MTSKPTPLCDMLAAMSPKVEAELTLEVEAFIRAAAFEGEGMRMRRALPPMLAMHGIMQRLNDRDALNRVFTHMALKATCTSDITNAIRTYILTGRTPF